MSPHLPLSLQLLRRFRRTDWRAGVILAGLLVLASLLGVLHAIAHPPEPLQAPMALDASARVQLAAQSPKRVAASSALLRGDAATEPSGWGALFHHKAGGLDCRLFDQLCHGPAAPITVVHMLSFALPIAAVLMTLEGEYIARWSALFDARGPPRST